MQNDFLFKFVKPPAPLTDFVESFWMLQNLGGTEKEIVVIPNGRIDVIFSQSATEPFHITRSGLETHAQLATLQPNTLMFAISFKLMAVEYVFHHGIASLLDYAEHLAIGFWGFNACDLQNFKLFCEKAAQQIQSLVSTPIDNRKQKLFDLIYISDGEISVKELSGKVYWSSRQINRYFNQQFGLSLKAYCNILRFWASLEHLAHGKLFPGLNFTDQSHFIKEIKRFAGVVPKELVKNKNGRFLQFSVLGAK